MLNQKFIKPIENLKKEFDSILDYKNIQQIQKKILTQLNKVKTEIKKDIELNMSNDFKPLKSKIQKQKQEVDNMIKNLIHEELQKAQDYLDDKKKELKKMQLGIEKYIHNELKVLKPKRKTKSTSATAKSNARSAASKKLSKIKKAKTVKSAKTRKKVKAKSTKTK